MMRKNSYGRHAKPTLRRTPAKFTKSSLVLVALSFILVAAIGGTFAYLKAQSGAVTNEFKPGKAENEITEEFDKTVKKNVNVKNTGDIPAYIRVKLVTYRVNDKGDRIGGTAEIPTFTLGDGWVKYPATGDDIYYYYTKPVDPDQSPAKPLIGKDGITLITYTDADGGKQVVEVIGEAIQSTPPEAVGEAWGVTITDGNVTPYSTNGGGE